MRRYFALIVVALMVAFCASARADLIHIDVEFEDIAAGTQFQNSDLPATFVTEGVSVSLTDASGYGSAMIETNNHAGASGNELWLSAGARAELDLGLGSTGGFFHFADLGGDNSLDVNGSSVDFDVILASGSGTIGGVGYNCSALSGYAHTVKLGGPIQTLAFTGEELAIDSVDLTISVPEPSCLVLLCGLLGIAFGHRVRG
jgi:hypothetical protein